MRLVWDQEVRGSNPRTPTNFMTTTPYANIAYARLNIDYDHDQFAYEFDRFVLTRSQPQYNEARERDITAALNAKWGMVDNELYVRCDAAEHNSWETKTASSVQRNGQPTWQQFALTEINPSAITDELLATANQRGTVAARNYARHLPWRVKPVLANKNLEILNFVYQKLCLERVVFVAGVSLEPGRFATIHRDSMRLKQQSSNPTLNNGLYQEGFVVINLNITNGGVPLYWSMDGADVDTPRFIDDAAYMSSDYFLHGVPVVHSRRRQIRVTGIPGPGFEQLIDRNTAVVIPENYEYDARLETLSLE